jgi:hypothetical protein
MLTTVSNRVKDRRMGSQDEPDWRFNPDHGLKCPGCSRLVTGLNWRFNTLGLLEEMDLIPCGHELPTDTWELTFSGRDRRLGTVIRIPKFLRKDGS